MKQEIILIIGISILNQGFEVLYSSNYRNFRPFEIDKTDYDKLRDHLRVFADWIYEDNTKVHLNNIGEKTVDGNENAPNVHARKLRKSIPFKQALVKLLNDISK